MGGVILLGVEELPDTSLRAVGVKDPNKLLDDFWNTVNNPQKVSENVLTDSDVQALSHDDVTIIQITVPRADRRLRPIYLNDNTKRSFRRNRSGDYLCRYEEIQGMMRDAADQSQDSRTLPRVGIGGHDLAPSPDAPSGDGRYTWSSAPLSPVPSGNSLLDHR